MKDYKKNWIYTLVFMGVLVMILASCEKEDNNNDNNQTPTLKIPELTTSGVSNITKNSASCGGNIISDGGAIVTIQGVCWSTSNTPTIADNKTTDSTGTNIFTSNLVEITHKTTYYVCAYATNSVGTGYGNVLFFTTLDMPYGSITDIDGNTYRTIEIGTQTWMADNLKTTKYNDGTDISLVVDDETWSNLTDEGYCWFNNDEVPFKDVFGALYNWEVVNTEKLCPTGWHVPTNDEWTTLTNYLGGKAVAGGKLKETGTAWYTPNTGATNETGFSGLPSGLRNWNGEFGFINFYGNWWSSTQFNFDYALYRGLGYDFNRVDSTYATKEIGFSVRCLKD